MVNNRATDGTGSAVQDWMARHPRDARCVLLRNDQNYGLGGSHKDWPSAMRRPMGMRHLVVLPATTREPLRTCSRFWKMAHTKTTTAASAPAL